MADDDLTATEAELLRRVRALLLLWPSECDDELPDRARRALVELRRLVDE